MITKEACKRIVDLAVDYAQGKADEVEVSIAGSNVATSRFANNAMTQNQSPDTVAISVRVIKDGKQARLSSDRCSDSGIKELVQNAITAVSLLKKAPELLALPELSLTPSTNSAIPGRLIKDTADLSANERADRIRTMIDVAKQYKVSAAGVYASGAHFTAIGNSNGLFLYHNESEAECSITMSAQNSSGWAKAQAPDAQSVPAEALAERAAQKAISSADPSEIAPGRYTVILEPSAVLDLISQIWWDFTGTSHLDKLSCLLNKVGEKVFGENITIMDDVSHPLQAGEPFDGEGLTRSVVTLVDKGVVKNLVHGRKSAKKFGVKPTGHGLAEPTPMGEYPMNLVVGGGSSSVEEMIRTTDKGILLTRVWYVRQVDPATKLMTGMTRDGTFLVEGGTITKAVKNMRFNISVIEVLNNVLALGPSVRAAGEEGFPAVVPAMKVANFNFTSTTKF